MIIIGAGMAGLLAAGMLQQKCSFIYERSPQLPNNHSAVLRFRSNIVGDALNIPFKQVEVLKASHPYMNPVADALCYSRKTNGTGTIRSITTANGQLEQRYIAPPDLVQQMADRCSCKIIYNATVDNEDLIDIAKARKPIVSTMPMPQLMQLIGWEPQSEFRTQQGKNIIADLIGIDAYCSLYVPDPNLPISRISITGSQLIVECSQAPAFEKWGNSTLLCRALDLLGLQYAAVDSWEAKHQQYAKILPIDEQERKRFILYATEQYGIYSLGRYATWRPGLLLDDVVHDVRVIQRLEAGESHYDHVKGK